MVLVSGSFVLAIALPANASERRAQAVPYYVQKAEKCIRAARSKEDLAIKDIQGQITFLELHPNLYLDGRPLRAIVAIGSNVMSAAQTDLKCAVDSVKAVGVLDLDPAESRSVRVDLADAQVSDTNARDALTHSVISHRDLFDHLRKAIELIKRANGSKDSALARLEEATAPSPTTSTSTPNAAANSQTPCNNQNSYDPKFPDYTQLHEYCSKPVTALTIHASVSMTAAGWFGPAFGGAACIGDGSKTVSCANITKLPKLTAFIAYASHKGGWPSGDTASVIFTFADGTKQTETFYPH